MLCGGCGFQAPFEAFLVRGGRLRCSMCGSEEVTAPSGHTFDPTTCPPLSHCTDPQVVGAESPYQPAVYVASETDVKSEKESLKRYIDSTSLAVRNCAAIPAAERQGWNDFTNDFYRFYIQKEGSALPWMLTPVQSALALREQYQKTQQYRSELANWQTRLAPYCGGGVGPSITELQPPDPGILDRISQAEKHAHDTATTVSKYALWGGLALLAVFGIVAVTNIRAGNVGKIIEKMPVIPV